MANIQPNQQPEIRPPVPQNFRPGVPVDHAGQPIAQSVGRPPTSPAFGPNMIPTNSPGHAAYTRPPVSPAFRPGVVPPSSPGRPGYPTQQSGVPQVNYQPGMVSTALTPPPDMPASTAPGQRAPSPPVTTHKQKRVYPKQIGQAYSESAPYDPMHQTYTPAAVASPQMPGIPGQQQPPLVPQSPQFFTPAAANTLGTQIPAYSQAYVQPAVAPAPNVAGMANQFGQMNLTGQHSSPLIPIHLIGTQPDVSALDAPPPPITLPPNASVTTSEKANCDLSYKRCTLNAIPATSSLLTKSRLPFALVITPYRSLKEGDDPVPVVTDTVIARCRRCRTYINPFVNFVDGGQRWQCNLCYLLNEVPNQFDWDIHANKKADRWQRAEINHAVVEFVAPTEYMVRPPQPPVYVFVIDVSYPAVQSGAVATAARTILESLDRLPNEDNRTKIAIITVDVALHFYSLPMLVVSDLDDVFLPQPDDLLVNLFEAREALESLLGRLGDMFKDTQVVGNALGPALLAAYKLISPIGGKITVIQSSLPNINPGALKPREDPKALGTPKESQLLQPADSFYKTFAVDCSRVQISVDMFLLGSQYSDVATLSSCPRYIGGQTYFYPAFNASRSEDALKFAHEFAEYLASPIGLEAVVRVRASKGIRLNTFHGNFFIRQTDLLGLPTVSRDHSYVVEMSIEENISERRIRVLTLCLPVTNSMSELFASADQIAIASYLAHKAVERSLTAKLEDAREALTNKTIDILGAYKSQLTSIQSGASPQLQICDNLKLLPLLSLALLKHVGLRQSSQIPTDLRAYAMCLLRTMPSQLLIPYLYPRFYSLHNMPPEVGTYGPDGIIMPLSMNLTIEKLERHGCYMLEDSQNIFIWFGREVSPQLCMDLLGLASYEAIRGGKSTLPVLETDFSQKINAIIGKTRESRRGIYYPQLYIVKEDGDPALRLWFLSHIIEDRTDTVMSYYQWLALLKDKVNSGSF
ncbi:267_t:CDS:10 [Paraglomus occultum]|uniref:267_t:CDS:1 n=1 Tax=Paraglomus occultum TaxID=144539 RepID=A0A9N9BHR9_9GLOM|nr:267_t:CDS:10 [Paraglomus occultum]